MAVAHAVRDRMLEDWLQSLGPMRRREVKVVSYLSAEFLMGPHLGNNLVNLGIMESFRQAVSGLGQNLDELLRQEEEPGLGNGGLGRLAACFLDSLATLRVPAIGYGIRYEFGIFDQEIRDGWQVEVTDKWLRFGNPWEICRPEIACYVKFGGHTEQAGTRRGGCASAGCRTGSSRGSLTTPRWPATAPARPTCSGCGSRRRWSPSISRPSTRATITGPSTRRWSPRRSPRSSTPTTSRPSGSSCA